MKFRVKRIIMWVEIVSVYEGEDVWGICEIGNDLWG